MLMNILFLFFVFIFGLFYTLFSFFPRKKILAWFHSISVKTTSAHLTSESRSINGVGKRVELRSVFATFDKNNDGYITKQELRESLTNMGIFVSFDDAADMVAKVDSNGDGLVDFDEFHELYGSMMKKEGGVNDDDDDDKEGDLKEAFEVFDGDGDGLITVEELGLVLSSLGFKEGKTLESCKEMIKKVDIDGDGMVNFDEFKKMMKAGKNLISTS